MLRPLTLILLAVLIPTAIKAQNAPRHSSLANQKMCAEQARKFYKEDTDFSTPGEDHVLKNEFTSHFDDASNVCYVRIDYNTIKNKQVTISSYVFDAFEGRGLASYIWFSEEGKKAWQVKPVECQVGPIRSETKYCTSSSEFETLVEQYFGLGSL
jgi:hypothetical protein